LRISVNWGKPRLRRHRHRRLLVVDTALSLLNQALERLDRTGADLLHRCLELPALFSATA
jgi:hypothetical protein